MTHKKIGIVLSSGGGRGVFGHTGFLKALEKLNVEISAMSGCSAGAIVGSVVASGGNLSDWAKALEEVSVDQFWTPKSKLGLLYNLVASDGQGFLGLSTSNAAAEFLSRHIVAKTFEGCIYPFYVVAINIGNGDKVLFSSNKLLPRVLASAAIPVLYEPVEIDNEYYSDGATVDLAPVDAICCKHNLDLVIIHHLAHRYYTVEELRDSFEKPWTILGIMFRLMYRHKPWYETGSVVSLHQCPCGCGADVIVVEPILCDLGWPLTTGGMVIMEFAEKQALDALGSDLVSDLMQS